MSNYRDGPTPLELARAALAKDYAAVGEPTPAVVDRAVGVWHNVETTADYIGRCTAGFDEIRYEGGSRAYRAWWCVDEHKVVGKVFEAFDQADPIIPERSFGDKRPAPDHDAIIAAAAVARHTMNRNKQASRGDMQAKMNDLMSEAQAYMRDLNAAERRRDVETMRGIQADEIWELCQLGKARAEARAAQATPAPEVQP